MYAKYIKRRKKKQQQQQHEKVVLHFSEKMGATLTFFRILSTNFVVPLVASNEDSCCQQSQSLL